MARGRSARVVINRKAMDKVILAVADGAHAVGLEYIQTADVPDAPPYGEGLVQGGGTITYAGPKKIAGWGSNGRQPQKPRAMRVGGSDSIQMAAGWGFPARLVALGTVDTPAHGWAHAALNAITPRIPSIIRRAAAYRIARLGR